MSLGGGIVLVLMSTLPILFYALTHVCRRSEMAEKQKFQSLNNDI